MTREDVYNHALEIAAQTVLNESSNLSLDQIANLIGVSRQQLDECLGDRQQFSIRVSARIGALIWRREAEIFGKIVESDKYKTLCGAAQIKELLLSSFYYSFRGHPDFWRWLYRFEQFVVSEKIPPEAMEDYQRQLERFYPIFLEAFNKGLGDGTVRPEIIPSDYYSTVTMALMNLCLKFCSAPIISSDVAITGERQISMLIDMAVHFLKR